MLNKRQRTPKGQSKLDNPEKLATQGTQNEDKQNKNKTQYVWYIWHLNVTRQINNNAWS